MEEEWPGNGEGEDEPKTEPIPDSTSIDDLFTAIKRDRKKEAFRNYECGSAIVCFSVVMTLCLIPVIVTTAIAGTWTVPYIEGVVVLSILLISIWIGIGIFLFIEGRRNYVYMNSVGICGKPRYGWKSAIEWDHVMYVEVHYYTDRFLRVTARCEISDFILRGNNRIMSTDNRIMLGRELTLETLSKYIRGLEDWTTRQKRGYSEGVLLYMNPIVERDAENLPDYKRPIDEWSEDIEHLASTEYEGSDTSEELLDILREDTSCCVYKDTGSLNFAPWMAIMISIFIVFLNVMVAVTSTGIDWPSMLLMSGIVLIPTWLITDIIEIRKYKKHGFFVTDKAVGYHSEFQKEAIEWVHVEWVDLYIQDGILKRFEIVGNRRKLRYKNPKKGRIFSHEEFEIYIPEYCEWDIVKSNEWGEGWIRYRKPTDES